MAEVARGSLASRQQAERLHVVVELGHLGGGQVEVVDAELAGLAEDVVVDVGDVAHAAGVVAPVAQAPLEDVVGEVDRGVADVGGVVRRDAARVHGDDRARARTARPRGGPCRTGASARRMPSRVRRRYDLRPCRPAGRRGAPSGGGLHLGERPGRDRLVETGEADGDPGLVADVDLQQHGGERLDGGGVRQLAGVEGPQVRELARRSRWSPRWPAGGRSRRARRTRSGWSRSPSSLAGTWWKAAATHDRGTAACTLAATEPRGGTSGWNSWPTLARALAIEMTTFPRSWSAHRRGGLAGAVPRRGDDDDVGLGGPSLSAASMWRSRPGHRPSSLSIDLHGPVLRPGADDDVVAAPRPDGRRGPDRQGPVAPRTPMRMAAPYWHRTGGDGPDTRHAGRRHPLR